MVLLLFFFFSSRRRHTRCALVTGVQTCALPIYAGRSFTASWIPPEGSTDAAGRCLQQPVAQQAADCIRAARDAQVVSVDTERVREAPPLPFDLGTLQELCSKQLRLDVQETLDIAQALYETHKVTTSPRSDTGYTP